MSSSTEKATPFVSTVEGGYILPETGLVLTPDFKIIEESTASPNRARQATMAALSRQLFFGDFPLRQLLFATSTVRVADSNFTGPVAPLIPRYQNYYHWMITELPKIRYLIMYEKQCDEEIILLVPESSPRYVAETLELLNWPTSRVAYIKDPAHIVQNLLIPSWSIGPTDYSWLSKNILKSISNRSTGITEPSTTGNNVYVSRANAIERRVVNEDEVMDVLSQFGFSRYLLEERSVAENASLFANADIVVGPHGAGLTDIIFSSDATLVELFGAKVKDPYRRLAADVGVEYESMLCHPDSSDIVVDTDALADRISTILEK
jgi:capsular polysaccharide biosynthesis protein